jgi:hypothetical protein
MMLCAMLLALPVAAEPANLALGKPYTFEPAPSYAHCTDPGDATQLTDGVYTKDYFWVQPTTVGWQSAKPIVITIDLGSVQSISGVSVNTAAGAAGVAWPAAIDVLVADEAKQFHALGNLVALDAPHGVPAPETYAVHRYYTDALRTHGRYVAFVVTTEPFFFCDEIEVRAGDAAFLNEPLPGAAIADPREQYKQSQISTRIQRRLREDALAIKEKIKASSIEAAKKDELNAKLDGLVSQVSTAEFQADPGFRTILPLNPLHEQILAVQAERWRMAGLKPVTVWQSGLWDRLDFLAEPDTSRAPALEIVAMQNEYRAGSFNISNASEKRVALRMHFEGIPNAATPDYLRVFEVPWTDTAKGVPVAAALLDAQRQNEYYYLHIPAGMTRQVWFTFQPKTLEPKTYTGRIVLEGVDVEANVEVPVSLQVFPVRFPDQPTLHFGGWDYTDNAAQYDVSAKNRDALVKLLREYWVDSPWGSPAVLTYGKFDAAGAMTEPPNTAHFDQWVDRWPGARQYLMFPSVGSKIGQLNAGTPEFDRAVIAWTVFWAEHAKSKGIDPKQLGLLLFDEPSTAEPQAIIAAWARAMRAANTGLRVWEDPVFGKVEEADTSMLGLCDALCPNRPLFLKADDAYRALFTTQRDPKSTLEFYSCSGPVRSLDPYSYHRLQAWDCFRYGATASYFWAFGDSGGASSWNEYALEHAAYTPLFIDEDGICTGKHMEACREGIEDYEYLVMLRAKGGSDALLNEVVTRVCDAGRLPSFQWSDPLDRGVADAARKQILEALSPSR